MFECVQLYILETQLAYVSSVSGITYNVVCHVILVDKLTLVCEMRI